MRVFVRVPNNLPSGGIRVANQLVNLFRENNLESLLVVDVEPHTADWMTYPAPVISEDDLIESCGTSDIVIDNWIDRKAIETTKRLKANIKIYYSQGSTFLKTDKLVGDEHLRKADVYTHYWAQSRDSRQLLGSKYPATEKWHLVHPYFEIEIIDSIRKGISERDNGVLCLQRKGGKFIRAAKSMYGNRIEFHIVNWKYSESEMYYLMAKYKYFLSTGVGVSPEYFKNKVKPLLKGKKPFSVINPYKEGFPLPPAEAALCGSIVIGFAMGGGLEWMSSDTLYLAKDRSKTSLLAKLKEAIYATDDELEGIRDNAWNALKGFNNDHTWRQIEAFLQGAT